MTIYFANIHPETGVRYTIYHINNDLHPEIWDTIYRDGGEPLEQVEARSEALTKAEEALRDLGFGKWAVEACLDRLVEDFDENYECDEPTYEGETDGIKWRVTWLGGAPHLFVLESPYFGCGVQCSPCVPGAVSGSSILSIWRDEAAAAANAGDGDYGYCLPKSWLREEDDQ